MAFQTDKMPLPARLWGDGVNPVSGSFGSNHSQRLMLRESVCSPGCGAVGGGQEMIADGVVFSKGVLVTHVAPAGSGWQPNGR